MTYREFTELLTSKLTNCPVLKSLAIAQACLESDFGKRSFYNNYYGIKCHNPNKYAGCRLGKTKEVVDGQYKDYRLAFQTYNSIDESIGDYCRLMNLTRYKLVRKAKNYIEATQAIKDCGYATSLSYITSLRKIIEQYKLYELDYRMNKLEKITNDFKWGEFFSGDIKLGLKSIEPPLKYYSKILQMAEELQIVRDYIKSKIIINSGWRTKEWNAHEKGVKNSYHCQGLAVDIRVVGMKPYDLAIYVAKLTEFKGYGINIKKEFLHIDLRPRLTVFTY